MAVVEIIEKSLDLIHFRFKVRIRIGNKGINNKGMFIKDIIFK